MLYFAPQNILTHVKTRLVVRSGPPFCNCSHLSNYALTVFFVAFRVTFLIPRVKFKPTRWHIENAQREDIFPVWRHDFFVLRDVHSQRVYLQGKLIALFASKINRSEFVLIIFSRSAKHFLGFTILLNP